MKTRKIGEFEVSAVGYGCMGLSHAHGYALEDADAIRTIREAFDAGYTYFDTATTYTGVTKSGHEAINEVVVGEALRPVRDQVVVGTKFGVIINPDHSLTYDSSREVVRATIEKSLRQTGFEVMDIACQARRDPNTSPEELAETMAELIAEGKVRYWGISEVEDEDFLRKAHAVAPMTTIQNKLNMSARETERLFPVLDELGISATIYTPLMKGFLSLPADVKNLFREGDDYRKFIPAFSEKGVAEAAPLYALLNEYSEKHNCTWTQLSLAWILNKRPYLIPIPGTKNPDRMRENLAAADIVLTSDEMADIDRRLEEMQPESFGVE